MSTKIIEAIAVTAELTNTELSKPAILAMESDLSRYPEEAVFRALTRCRRELTGRLTLAAILDRLGEEDGRPSADEAWAIACPAIDEDETVVWTDEISKAFSVARPILAMKDKVGARMAFKDAYERIVRVAKESGSAARWFPSIGFDADRRAIALSSAIERNLIAEGEVRHLLPAPKSDLENVVCALIEDKSAQIDKEQLMEKIGRLRMALSGKAPE